MSDAPMHPLPSGCHKNRATKNPNAPRKRPDRSSVSASAATIAKIDSFARAHELTRFAAVDHLLRFALAQDERFDARRAS